LGRRGNAIGEKKTRGWVSPSDCCRPCERAQGPIRRGRYCWKRQDNKYLAKPIAAGGYGSLRSQGRRKSFRIQFQRGNAPSRSRGADRPSFASSFGPPLVQRAQGRPGARCTRGLACNCAQRTRTRAYRFSGNTPAFPAQWLYGLLRALPGERLFCHRRHAGYASCAT
jgi:hypothetical protein